MKKLTLAMSAACVATALAAGAARADCQSDAMSIRQEIEEKGKVLQAAIKKKSDPQTLCPLFKAYTAVEAKWVKFLGDNKDWCQIPAQVIEQAASGSKKAVEVRNNVCNAAANGGGGGGPAKPPPQGSMSSALGVTTGYNIGNSKGGVFDTLSGNALK